MDFTDTKPIQNVGTDLSLPSPAATSAPAPASSAPAPVIKRRSPIACRRWVNATNRRALPRSSPVLVCSYTDSPSLPHFVDVAA